MSNDQLFVDLLESSKTEQMPVSVYLSSHIINGIVTNVYPEYAELRTNDGKRCVVVLRKVQAISAS